MGKPTVFIDGHAGTTGLRIREWLRDRDDLELLTLDGERRRNRDARRDLLNRADLSILCLPDDTAREAVSWIEVPGVRVIDTSTAHRVADGWLYGLPELAENQREAIREERRVSNPGCYASAVILALRPLVDAGLLSADSPVAIHALSGYSGGGRSMIEKWEAPGSDLVGLAYEAPYALETVHKHVAEMTRYSGLLHEPHFIPAVGPFRSGMRVQIPLHESVLAPGATAHALREALSDRYASEKFVRVLSIAEAVEYDETAFDPTGCNGTNRLEIAVIPNPLGHVLLMIRLDNLGKGASGAAIQNMNLMLGLPEDRGLPV